MAFTPTKHELVPKHSKLSEKDKEALLEKYNITSKELPVIFIDDPGLEGLKIEVGDVVKIERPSYTAKSTVFYRRVSHE